MACEICQAQQRSAQLMPHFGAEWVTFGLKKRFAAAHSPPQHRAGVPHHPLPPVPPPPTRTSAAALTPGARSSSPPLLFWHSRLLQPPAPRAAGNRTGKLLKSCAVRLRAAATWGVLSTGQ